MGTEEAKKRLTEARTIGYKNFGQKYTTTDKLHMPLREVAGKAQHPGPGYSERAFIDGKGRIHTDNVYDATRALYEKREVVLNQPREVSTLLEHLQKVSAEFVKMGAKAPPVFDLCKLSVEGTNLFCAESKGIPRIQMPQFDKEQTKKFRHYLQAKGYEISKEKEFASYLRATQNELNGTKVAGIANAMITGKLKGKEPRLVVSRDNYILDGHHRWAALVGVDAVNNKLGDKLMKVSRVNIGITELLREAEEFGAGHAGVEESGMKGAQPTPQPPEPAQSAPLKPKLPRVELGVKASL